MDLYHQWLPGDRRVSRLLVWGGAAWARVLHWEGRCGAVTSMYHLPLTRLGHVGVTITHTNTAQQMCLHVSLGVQGISSLPAGTAICQIELQPQVSPGLLSE